MKAGIASSLHHRKSLPHTKRLLDFLFVSAEYSAMITNSFQVNRLFPFSVFRPTFRTTEQKLISHDALLAFTNTILHTSFLIIFYRNITWCSPSRQDEKFLATYEKFFRHYFYFNRCYISEKNFFISYFISSG